MPDRVKKLQKRKGAVHDHRRRLLKRAHVLKRLGSRLDARIEMLRKRRGELGTNRGCVDGATTWLGLKLMLLDLRAHGWGGVLNAADRTQAHCDDCGNKSSQAELYECFQSCGPQCSSCFPANPPGHGTHEGINDGTAYPNESTGKRLEWWQWGLDVSLPDAFLAAAARCGYHVRRPYGNEAWHINLTANPRDNLIKRGRV